MYVRVVGTVKTFSNKRHLAATHIRPIKDHNEVFYHLLECQYVSLVMKKGKLVSIRSCRLRVEKLWWAGRKGLGLMEERRKGRKVWGELKLRN